MKCTTLALRLMGHAGMILCVALLASPVLADPLVYASTLTGEVVVFDTESLDVVTTIDVGEGPQEGIAIQPGGSHVYVCNSEAGSVSVIETATHTVVETIAVGDGPYGVAFHPEAAVAFVSNADSGTVTVIDTDAREVTSTVPVNGGPRGLAVHPAGGRVYVAAAAGTVSVIDTANLIVVDQIGPFLGSQEGIAVAPSGDVVYVTQGGGDNYAVIDVATGSVAFTVFDGEFPVDVVFLPSGNRAFISNASGGPNGALTLVDAATHQPIGGVTGSGAGEFSWGLAAHPDGDFVYAAVPNGDAVWVVDTATREIVDSVAVPSPRRVAVGGLRPELVTGCIELLGEPLVGRVVSVRQAGQATVSTLTDDAGCYSFEGLEPGVRFRLTISGPPIP